MRAGIVGLGKMGSGIAARLAEKGFRVIGWDADPAPLDALRSFGGEVVGSPAEVAAAADCVISIVSDRAGVLGLYNGRSGFLSVPVEGKLFIEMSTVGPEVAHELEPLVTARGGIRIEAPVMGSVKNARDGSLSALVGGTPQAVEKAKPYLEAMTSKFQHLGPAGCGYTMKLSMNLFMGNYLQAIAEALALATSAGISLDTAVDMLKESPCAARWLAIKEPILRGGTGPIALDIVSLRKDMMEAVAAGTRSGVPMPGTAAVLSAVSAAVAHGEGALDLSEHARFFREHLVQKPRYAVK